MNFKRKKPNKRQKKSRGDGYDWPRNKSFKWDFFDKKRFYKELRSATIL